MRPRAKLDHSHDPQEGTCVMRSVYVNEDWVQGKVYLLADGKTSLSCVSWREEYGGVALVKDDRVALASTAEIKIDLPKKATIADVACVHRGDATRTLEGCGCGTAPGVYACGYTSGECIPFVGTGKKEKAVRGSGLAICEECSFRVAPG